MRELAYIFIQPEGDPLHNYYDALVTLLEAIEGGLLHTEQFKAMGDLRGMVITKPGYTEQNLKARLIGIPSALVRLAASWALKDTLRRMTPQQKWAATGHLQFAVDNEAGHTGPGVLMQSLFDGAKWLGDDEGEAPQTSARVIFSVDITKAFHSVSRVAMRRAVQAHAPELLWYVDSLYSAAPNTIHLRTEHGVVVKELIQTGVVPGDALGTFLFCVTLHDGALRGLMESRSNVALASYADDITACLRLDELEPFAEALASALQGIGCALNQVKCAMLVVGGTQEDGAVAAEMAARLGFRLEAEGIVIAGIPVGSAAYRKRFADELATKVIAGQEEMVRALASPGFGGMPRLQAYLRALRLTGPSSFAYAARGIVPELLTEAAARVDAAFFDLFLSETSMLEQYARMTDEAQERAKVLFGLAKRYAGLGVLSVERSCVGAYLGGAAALARVLKSVYRGADIDLFLSDAAKAHVAFRGACPGSKIAAFATFGEAAMKEGKSMQMAVTAALSKRALRELRHGAPKEQKLAIIAASGKATAWLDANCRFVDYRLSDGALRDAVGQLLGMPLSAHGAAAACGACGKSASHNPAEGYHAFNCKKSGSRQEAATMMHIAGGSIIASLMHRGLRLEAKNGWAFTRAGRPYEPTLEAAGVAIGLSLASEEAKAKSFDLGFRTPGEGAYHFVDFSRTATISAASMARATEEDAGFEAKKGEKSKVKKYKKLITNFDAKEHHITMAIMETHGATSPGFTRFLKTVAFAAFPPDLGSGKSDVDGIRSRCMAQGRQRMAVGLARANHATYNAWRKQSWPDPAASP